MQFSRKIQRGNLVSNFKFNLILFFIFDFSSFLKHLGKEGESINLAKGICISVFRFFLLWILQLAQKMKISIIIPVLNTIQVAQKL